MKPKVFIPILLLIGFIASALTQATGISALFSLPIAALVIVACAFLPKSAAIGGVFMASAIGGGIDTEIWVNHLIETLWPNNEFLLRSEDDSMYVNNLSVHKPNAGDITAVVKNRDLSAGAQIAMNQRTDTIVSYDIDEYTTDPFRILNAEEAQLSYNKRESILKNKRNKLMTKIADETLYVWGATAASAANIIRSSGFVGLDTGNTVVTEMGNAPSATGTRKVFCLYDIKRAATLLNNQNVPLEGRVMVMSANRYQEITDELATTKQRDNSHLYDGKNGIVNRIEGFDIYLRSSVLIYDNTGTPVKKAVGAAADAADNDGVLFWQETNVARALGEVRVFETLNSATAYGDVYSALVRHGATMNRSTQVGVGAIVQAHGV